MAYTVENLISNDERAELIKLYNSRQSNIAHQDYNLFNMDKRLIPSNYWNELDSFKKIRERANRSTYSHYFLMYEEGSFTKFHTDNDDEIGLTIVTLLDEVDLVGGETIVQLPFKEPKKKEGSYVKGTQTEGQRVIPKVVEVEKGQSMIYDRSLMHGVAQVVKGKRLVLVSWFYNDEREVRVDSAHKVAKK